MMRSTHFFKVGELVIVFRSQLKPWAYAVGKVAKIVRRRIDSASRPIYDLDLPEPPCWKEFAGGTDGWQTFYEWDLRHLNGIEKAVRRNDALLS